jgi:hypothetical protein
VALPHAVVDVQRRRRVTTGEQVVSGLAGALQRARDDRDQRDDAQPLGRRDRLGATGVVEADAGRPPGEHPAGVRGGPAVPDEDHSGHVATL